MVTSYVQINAFDVATAVAAEMGPGWTARRHGDDRMPFYATMHGPAGEEISFNANSHKKTLCLRGRLDSKTYSSKPEPSINVSASKSPKIMAGDIRRRLLPDYLPVLAEVQKRKAENDASDARAAENARYLAGVVGCQLVETRNGNGRRLDLYRSRFLPEMTGEVEVSSDTVTFSRFYVTPTEAAAMLSALIDARRKG